GRVVKGRVVEDGATPPARAKPAVILEGLHNYHTHMGDAFLRGRPLPRGIDELVRPVTGYKHRMLASAGPATLQSGVRRVLQEYANGGARSILDFREQGVQGVGWVRRVHDALGPHAPQVRLLGRPAKPAPDEAELEDLVERADGLGLPSLSDVGPASLAAAAAICHRARKPLAIHASEQRREDIDVILGSKPDLLVHLNAATAADLRKVARADVPVAVCPTSNAYFRIRSQVRSLRRAGIAFFLGTDNAMLGGTDLVEEARLAKRHCPEVKDEELLRALTTPPEKAIKHVRRVPAASGAREPVVVLPLRRGRVRWGGRPVVARR
ncbi:MAG: amidohydrolase family protein, partial [Euryarchaeota archaeon]|nr:amidohydrolase family protein [Euryarchaeota archaeon]